ncbi:hypothetical protein T4D_7552 [Trichinella pseudospiralis]|uniref:Uncharacterized protein n=1 Tax=Trichinella pseudospiralis TaxID=6337 RepID=A0A0V1FB94_TRIPS|nr:hypothetical protein T4D_7552 [Trichinella pseudospiralis]
MSNVHQLLTVSSSKLCTGLLNTSLSASVFTVRITLLRSPTIWFKFWWWHPPRNFLLSTKSELDPTKVELWLLSSYSHTKMFCFCYLFSRRTSHLVFIYSEAPQFSQKSTWASEAVSNSFSTSFLNEVRAIVIRSWVVLPNNELSQLLTT